MTWVDVVVLGVLAVSGLLALARGLVREVLGLGTWAGAAAFAYWAMPLARPRFEHWIASPQWAGIATGAALFIGALLPLMLVSGWIGKLVRASVLGGLDRTLGLVFGLARGALLVVFVYIAAGMVIPPNQWPDAVKRARSLHPTYEAAAWLIDLLPSATRPHLAQPPAERETTAAELLHAQPLGRAVGPSPRDQTR